MQFFSSSPLPRNKLSAFTISQMIGARQSLPYGKISRIYSEERAKMQSDICPGNMRVRRQVLLSSLSLF